MRKADDGAPRLDLARQQLLHGPQTLKQLGTTSLAALQRDYGRVTMSEMARRERVRAAIEDSDPTVKRLGVALRRIEGA